MSTHTTGPWTYIQSRRSGLFHVESSIDAPVAGVAVCSVATGEGNARMVAAAPQLYDVARALRQHLALFCGPDDAIAAELFRIADAAIATAKGTQ